MEAFEEVPDTLEEHNKGIITCTDTGSCLIRSDMMTIQLKAEEIHTARRTSTPTKIAFAGGNGT
jgi:hypothetical protein